VTDPDKYRVLEFNKDGQIVRVWGAYSSGIDGFGKPVGIAVDAQDHVWVVDSGNNYLLRFTLPALGGSPSSQISIPAIPASPVNLTLDTNSMQLVDSFGKAYYQLDESKTKWMPLIPSDLANSLPLGTAPTQDENGLWILKGADGGVLYQWNEGALLWITTQPQPTATK
jgi:hypothetical protein